MTFRDRLANGVAWPLVAVLTIIHLTALAGALLVPSRAGIVVLIVAYLITGFGVTAGYHRRLTHRAYIAPKWFDRILAVLGMLAGQGTPMFWVAYHRKHHAFSDEFDDPHSPRAGFWWAHCLWFVPRRSAAEMQALYSRWTPEMMKDRFYLFLEASHLWWHVAAGVFLIFLGEQIGGWRMGASFLIYGLFLRIVLALHATWLVNSACHRWGYQNYQTGDDSRNNALVGLAALGEGWHNNHHHMQNTANHGHRWWELDISFLAIMILAQLRLVHSVRVHFGGKTAVCFDRIGRRAGTGQVSS